MIDADALHQTIPAAAGRRVYLDHAATSPLRPAVAQAMAPWWAGSFGNAASGHAEGRLARRAVSEARARVAALIGARPEEVVFTSGATEASNLAVRGAAHARRSGGKRVVSTRIEHAATRAACEELAVAGWHVTLLGVDGAGRLDPDALDFPHGTAVVSVIGGHNELGTIQPLSAIAEAAHRVGALFHVDAVQMALYEDLADVPWDMLSLSAHKLGGPQGVGALVRRGSPAISPLVVGGSQEGGLRPGTVPVALAVGFGAAAEAASASREAESARLGRLRDRLGFAIKNRLPALKRLGPPPEQALPHILSFGVEGLSGEELVHWLDAAGLSVSSASACLSGARSPVLDAIGLAEGATMLRLSFGWSTDEQEVEDAIERLASTLERLWAMPAFGRRSGPFAQRAEEAGLALTPAHWEAASALFAFYEAEGVLPGARTLARKLPGGQTLDKLFPYGLSTLAYWLGLPIPRGGCRPYAG